MKRSQFLLVVVLAASLTIASWVGSVMADGPTSTPVVAAGQSIVVTGAIVIDGSGQMTVGGFVIVPATSNVPSLLRPGDVVIIVGALQPDGKTIYTDSITLYDDSATFPPTVTPATIVAPFPTPIWTPMPTQVRTSDKDDHNCDPGSQPVAQRIAAAFNVSYDDVIQMHCAGNGFGEITRAFLLQTKTNVSAWTYLQRHHDGEGWGQIIKDAGVQPSDLAPGQVISKGPKCEDGNGPPGQCKKLDDHGPGQDNGHGHDNGNGNGQGNGNGHGND